MDLERFMFDMNRPEKHEHFDMIAQRADSLNALNEARQNAFENDSDS